MQLSRSRADRSTSTFVSRPAHGRTSASAGIAECERVASISGRGPEPIGKAPPTYAGAAAPLIGYVTLQAATGRVSLVLSSVTATRNRAASAAALPSPCSWADSTQSCL